MHWGVPASGQLQPNNQTRMSSQIAQLEFSVAVSRAKARLLGFRIVRGTERGVESDLR